MQEVNHAVPDSEYLLTYPMNQQSESELSTLHNTSAQETAVSLLSLSNCKACFVYTLKLYAMLT